MDKYIKKQEMFVILDNAPAGVDKSKLIDKYVANGYKIEGINDQPEPQKPMTGLDNATFKATGNEGIIGGTAKAIGNLPRSTFELGKNVASAVLNPIDTIKSVGTIVKGAGAKLAETALEKTDLGQTLLQKMSDSRVARGLEPLKTDETGKLQVEDTKDLQAINQVGKFVTDRYGSLDKFKETAIEDPAGVLADLATVLTGTGTVVSKVGTISKVGEVGKVGQTVTKVGQMLEPVTAISKTMGGAKNLANKTTLGRMAGEVIPTSKDMQRSQVTKALDLTQGDLATIGKKTGNDVTDFMVSKNLLKETPEAVADSLNEFRKATRNTKANEISKVKNVYTPEQVPSVIKGLNTIYEDVDGIAGLEKEAAKIDMLRNKKQFTLGDIQEAQDLLDQNSSIYSKLGDAKSSSKAKGLDNIRRQNKTFIENEVDTATNGQTNIRQINNDIQTSRAIEDAINTRATRNLTRQKLSLSDSVVLFGGGATFTPAVGIGLYLGKKIIETPSFRLAFTKALNAQPVAKVKRLISEVKAKNVSPEIQKMINDLAREARNNLQVIESGSNVLDKSKQEK